MFLRFVNFYQRFIQGLSWIATLLTSIFRTTSVDPTTIVLITISENSTIDEVNNIKVNEAKIDTKIAKFKSKDKSKSKNLVKFFSAKSQASGSGTGFLTLGARQAFIETPIFIILIQIVISGLKLMYLAMLLVESSVN